LFGKKEKKRKVLVFNERKSRKWRTPFLSSVNPNRGWEGRGYVVFGKERKIPKS
jgi:hypothetical protein